MSRFRATRWLLGSGALVAGMAGVALHATVRDGAAWSAPLYYALPLPVAGGFLLMAAVFASSRLWRRLLFLASLGVLGWWFFHSYGWAYPARAKWKVITWNIARPRHPFPPLVALVRSERPDVVVLIESGVIPPGMTAYYERELPGYRLMAEDKGLSCLVRGRFLDHAVRGLVNGSDVARFRVALDGGQLDVYAADLGASPLLPRRPQLDMLAEVTRGRPRTLVMGDFNTPLESLQLAAMRESFTEARLGGAYRGFRETWFFNLPLLSLDQIWCSRDLKPVFATRRLSFGSDHDPVIATFSPVPEAR